MKNLVGKSFALLLLITIAVFWGSCTKEKIAERAIIGKWKIDRQVSANGVETTDTGSWKFTKRESSIVSSYNTDDIFELVVEREDGTEEVIGYEFFKGSKDMQLSFFDVNGRVYRRVIEMMTKNILIVYELDNVLGTKYFLSK